MRPCSIMPILAATTLLITARGTVAATVIDMPPPPKKVEISKSAPAPTSATDAAGKEVQPEISVGDLALARYSQARTLPESTYGPVWGYWGSYGHHFPFGFYGYRPHYPNWPDAYCGPGRYGRLSGGYRISISPWTYFGYRNRFGNYVYP